MYITAYWLIFICIFVFFVNARAFAEEAGKSETAWVTAPSGAKLYCRVHFPASAGKFPALVFVPGGLGDSGAFSGGPRGRGRLVQDLVNRGFIVAYFDPEGRGRSTGGPFEGREGTLPPPPEGARHRRPPQPGKLEDFNGFRQQDGLAAVIQYVAALPKVDKGRIGVVTFSYGITMGAGCLARHHELPVTLLADVEGPSSFQYICYRTGDDTPMPLWEPYAPKEEHEDFWKEREAVRFIPRLKCRYFRFQKELDHVHGQNKRHAMELLNAATEASVWNRCNDNPPNIIYDPEHPQQYRWEMDERKLADYLQELMMEKKKTPGLQ